MDAYDWKCLTFADRDDIVLDRMAGRGMDPRRFDAPLHDLAGAWRDHVISRLRTPTRPCGADGSQERADTALRALDALCGDLGLSFDWIAICIVGENRAMLKHCTNFLCYPDEQEMRAAATERADAGDDSGDEAA